MANRKLSFGTSITSVIPQIQICSDDAVIFLWIDKTHIFLPLQGLTGQSSRAIIGIKRMGDLDSKPFHIAAKRRYGKEADSIAMELCSLWDAYLRDSSWHPFKIIRGSGKEEVLHFHSVNHFTFSFSFSPWDSAMYFLE